ncbi:hypothetical protein CLV28_0686 [Sediminihabitans luteus]|uniref:Uncharacterized protein n=1 Tax=Sediminihabitans luteus TaxID=1138585 RepID=A0A2M9CZZ3_9CELL|nr:hypothetical protein [Sediminihabitans luteus]PJJ77467.1 hypothetical protein CLV28_0686 [Sediminihabitans luteus]GII98361.1 hypothetical protein Slu03_07390 [Sediminihabitans luteus]
MNEDFQMEIERERRTARDEFLDRVGDQDDACERCGTAHVRRDLDEHGWCLPCQDVDGFGLGALLSIPGLPGMWEAWAWSRVDGAYTMRAKDGAARAAIMHAAAHGFLVAGGYVVVLPHEVAAVAR